MLFNIFCLLAILAFLIYQTRKNHYLTLRLLLILKRLPKGHLSEEIVIFLYDREEISLGKLAELLGIDIEMAKLFLIKKKIKPNLGVESLESLQEDIDNC
jgi:predicted HTH domain antitoxin